MAAGGVLGKYGITSIAVAGEERSLNIPAAKRTQATEQGECCIAAPTLPFCLLLLGFDSHQPLLQLDRLSPRSLFHVPESQSHFWERHNFQES